MSFKTLQQAEPVKGRVILFISTDDIAEYTANPDAAFHDWVFSCKYEGDGFGVRYEGGPMVDIAIWSYLPDGLLSAVRDYFSN